MSLLSYSCFILLPFSSLALICSYYFVNVAFLTFLNFLSFALCIVHFFSFGKQGGRGGGGGGGLEVRVFVCVCAYLGGYNPYIMLKVWHLFNAGSARSINTQKKNLVNISQS